MLHRGLFDIPKVINEGTSHFPLLSRGRTNFSKAMHAFGPDLVC